MWCVPKLDNEYIERMEDVLVILAKPLKKREPVVAVDERPVQLLGSKRLGRSAAPGKIARYDYEYDRRGTANVFAVVAPREGRHWTHATKTRKGVRFAAVLKKIADAYPRATTIHLVMDNLSTHTEKSLVTAFGETAGRKLWRRFTPHFTPKHGSWLNPAECEIGMWSKECLGRTRVATLPELKRRTRAWNTRVNRQRRAINWQYTTTDARYDFRYEIIGTTPRAKY